MKYIGRETTVTVNGKSYTLSRMTRKIHAEFEEWAGTKLPNPLDVAKAKLKDFSPHLQEILVKEALKEARQGCSFASPEVQNLAGTAEGQAKLTHLLLKEHHPEITEDEAYEVAVGLVAEDDFLPGA